MKTIAKLRGLMLAGIVASSSFAFAAGPGQYDTPQRCVEAGGAVLLGPGPARKTWCRQTGPEGVSQYVLIGGVGADGAVAPADLAAERRALESTERVADVATGGRKKSLSPREQLLETQRRLDRVRGQSVLIRKRLQLARRARESVVSACLSDKLTQINVAARAADERAVALREAVARNDAAASGREFFALSILAERSDDIDAEARQCTGAAAAFLGESAVKVSVDPRTAPEDAHLPGSR